MTLWELPHGAPRYGVDVITHGEFWGAKPGGGCQHQWGTSVACPVVVGVLAMLLSSLRVAERAPLRSPAALKQLVMAAALPMEGLSALEQGAGVLSPVRMEEAMRNFTPHISAFPDKIDMTASGCPLMWPLCAQPLYASGQPVALNLTLFNSQAAASVVAEAPSWIALTAMPDGEGSAPHLDARDVLLVEFTAVRPLVAYSGFVGVRVSVGSSASAFSGEVAGQILICLRSDDTPTAPSEGSEARGCAARAAEGDPSAVVVPLRVRVVATPPRQSRLLFDLYHSSAYPFGFFPNDDLEQVKLELMDWNGDHPHTAFISLFKELLAAGMYVELLTSNWTSFNASNYAALLLLDPEEHFLPREVAKLQRDVSQRGLGLVVAADWFDAQIMKTLDYRDDATRQMKVCGSGGANVVGLNRLLQPFGIAFGTGVYEGSYRLGGKEVAHLSGAALSSFPAGGLLHKAVLRRVSAASIARTALNRQQTQQVAVLGLLKLPSSAAGWIIALGDSSCLDDALAHAAVPARKECRWVVGELLAHLLPQRGGNASRPAKPSVGARPLLFAHTLPLMDSYSDGAAASERELSDAQLRAFRSQSRVWSAMTGCAETNSSCTLPLVLPPEWQRALPREPYVAPATAVSSSASASARRGAAVSSSSAWAEAGLAPRHRSSAPPLLLHPHLMTLPLLGVAAALLLVCYWPSRQRRLRSRGSVQLGSVCA
uniref:Subtilisin n=1 Tax=Calcidiscus leptoporus TaxID=127549 RepID=A0A7S0J759_9EUKA